MFAISVHGRSFVHALNSERSDTKTRLPRPLVFPRVDPDTAREARAHRRHVRASRWINNMQTQIYIKQRQLGHMPIVKQDLNVYGHVDDKVLPNHQIEVITNMNNKFRFRYNYLVLSTEMRITSQSAP